MTSILHWPALQFDSTERLKKKEKEKIKKKKNDVYVRKVR